MRHLIIYRTPNSGDRTYEKYVNHLRDTVPEMCGADVSLAFRNLNPRQKSPRSFRGIPFACAMFVVSETLEDEWGRVESKTVRNDREYKELDKNFDQACEVAKDRTFGTFTFFPA